MTTATEFLLHRTKELDGPASEITENTIKFLKVLTQEVFHVPCSKFYFDMREESHYKILIVPLTSDSRNISKKKWDSLYAKISNKIGELPRFLKTPSYTVDFIRKYDESGKELLIMSKEPSCPMKD